MADEIDVRIAELEERVAALQAELETTRRDLTDAQLDQWKGRIDEMEVQMHLGRLDAEDQLEPVVEQLRNRWLDARTQLNDATTTASDVFSTLRTGIESAMDDIRTSLRSARDAAKD
ncbi:MAG: hypothetical protein JJU45_07825 [Acidimicrobiia bacterium]|nr:hypothetical protein [Acidimicrobiia bacterium]